MVGVLSNVDTFRFVVVVLGVNETIVYFVEFNVDGHHFFAAVDGDFMNVRRVAVFIVSLYLSLCGLRD